MANFDEDTTILAGGGRFRARLSPDWEVWGPFGGYVAAIALRAIGKSTSLSRPASVSLHFLSVAAFDDVEVEVTSLRRGKRSEALQARMTQRGEIVLQATGWVVADDMRGLEHDYCAMPAVPNFSELTSYSELADNFREWYPIWRASVDGRPVLWPDVGSVSEPVWHTWMRLQQPLSIADPFLDAARSLMWLDMMMWNAAVPPHERWPISHIAPSLDLSAVFHANASQDEWLLCDAHAPLARDNLIGCDGRVWSADGRLIASGMSTLFCRPNPMLPG